MSSKTWFITGTSTGLGRSLTEQLLAGGHRVAATLRKTALLDGLKATYGDRLWVAELDVTDATAIRRVVDRSFADLGRIDVVVNNAGYGLAGAVEEVTDEQIAHQLDTNVLGSIQVVRAALPHLRKQGGGRILQLSSMGGQIAFPTLALYHTTKWAMEGFFEALSMEVAAFGITTTLVEPGSAKTRFGSGSLVQGPTLAAYAGTPAEQTRTALNAGQFPTPGDPEKTAAAMITSAHGDVAPKRLLLGSDAYRLVHAALTERLAALEAQKDIALSTDLR